MSQRKPFSKEDGAKTDKNTLKKNIKTHNHTKIHIHKKA